MTDEEARQLPVVVDGPTLAAFGSTTFATDAGSVDVLHDLPTATGRRSYDDLLSRSATTRLDGIVIRVAALADISPASSTRIGPRTEMRFPSWRSCSAISQAPPRDELTSRQPAVGRTGVVADRTEDGCSPLREVEMSVFESCPVTPPVLRAELPLLDEAQLAAAAFLARYSGRTLESYRADLRQFFQWADDVGLAPLTATRAHVELYRASLDARGLAASTIDRRLSAVCGYYRFAHLDGRIPANPAQYVRRPRVHPSSQRGMDRGELARFLYTAERVSPMHAALAVLLGLNGLRVSEACGANIEDLGFERGHRTLHIVGKGNKPDTVPLVPRTSRTLDLAIGERTEGPILQRHDGQRLDPRTAYRWVRSIGNRAGLDHVHPHMLRAAFIMAALDAGVPLRDVQIAARHSDPRTTTVYDRRRQNYDRHAAYAVVALVTGG